MPEGNIADWLDDVTRKAKEAYSAVSQLNSVQAAKRAGSAMMGPGLMGGFMGYEAFTGDKGMVKGLADSITTMKVAEAQGKLMASSMKMATESFLQQNTLLARGMQSSAKFIETWTSVAGMMEGSVKTLSASTSMLGKSFYGLAQGIKVLTGPVGAVITVTTIAADVFGKWADNAKRVDDNVASMTATFKGLSKDTKGFDSGFMGRAAERFAGQGVGKEAFTRMMGGGSVYGLNQEAVAQAVAIANSTARRTGGSTEMEFAKIIENVFAKSTTLQANEFKKMMTTERLMGGPIAQAGPGVGATYTRMTESFGRDINKLGKIIEQEQMNLRLRMGVSPFRESSLWQTATAPIRRVGAEASADVGRWMGTAGSAATSFAMNMAYGAYAAPGRTLGLTALLGPLAPGLMTARPGGIQTPSDLMNLARGDRARALWREGIRLQTEQPTGGAYDFFGGGLTPGGMGISRGQIEAGKMKVITGARGVIGEQAFGAGAAAGRIEEEIGKLESRAEDARLKMELLKRIDENPDIQNTYAEYANLSAKAKQSTAKGVTPESEQDVKNLEKSTKEIKAKGTQFFETVQMMADNEPWLKKIGDSHDKTANALRKTEEETKAEIEKKRKQAEQFRKIEEAGYDALGIKREGLEGGAVATPKGQEDFIRNVQLRIIESKEKIEQLRARKKRTPGEEKELQAAINVEKSMMYQLQGYNTDSDEFKAYQAALDRGAPQAEINELLAKVNKKETDFMKFQRYQQTRMQKFALTIRPEVEKVERATLVNMVDELRRMGGSKESRSAILSKLAEGTGEGLKEAELLTDIEGRRVRALMGGAIGEVEDRFGPRMGAIQRGIAQRGGIRLGAEAGYMTSGIQLIREQAQRVLDIRKSMFEEEISFTTKYAESRMNIIKEHYDHLISMEKLKLEARDRQYAPHLAAGQEFFQAGQQAMGAQRGRYIGADYWRGQRRTEIGMVESASDLAAQISGVQVPQEVQWARAIRDQRRAQTDFRREQRRQALEDRMQMQNYQGTMGMMGQFGVGQEQLMGTEQGRQMWLGMLQQSQGAFGRRGVDVGPQMFQIIQRQQEEAVKKLGMELKTRGLRGQQFEEQTASMEGDIEGLKTKEQRDRARMGLAGKYKEAAAFYESIGDVKKYEEYQKKYQETLEMIPDELKRLHDDQMKIANAELLKHTQLLKIIALALGAKVEGTAAAPSAAAPSAAAPETAGVVPPQELTPDQKMRVREYYGQVNPLVGATVGDEWGTIPEEAKKPSTGDEWTTGMVSNMPGGVEKRTSAEWRKYLKEKIFGGPKMGKSMADEFTVNMLGSTADEWTPGMLPVEQIGRRGRRARFTDYTEKYKEGLTETPGAGTKLKREIEEEQEKWRKSLPRWTQPQAEYAEEIRQNRLIGQRGIQAGTLNIVPSSYSGRGIGAAESAEMEDENRKFAARMEVGGRLMGVDIATRAGGQGMLGQYYDKPEVNKYLENLQQRKAALGLGGAGGGEVGRPMANMSGWLERAKQETLLKEQGFSKFTDRSGKESYVSARKVGTTSYGTWGSAQMNAELAAMSGVVSSPDQPGGMKGLASTDKMGQAGDKMLQAATKLEKAQWTFRVVGGSGTVEGGPGGSYGPNV